MTTSDVDLAILVEEMFRLATDGKVGPQDHETRFLSDSLAGDRSCREYVGAGFALNVATAAAIRRSQGSAPALVLAPTTEVSTFNAKIRPPLEQLGLRLGFDVFVYGLPQTAEEETATDLDSDWEIEISRLFDAEDSELEVPIPYDQPDDVWDDVRRLRPGLVALLGQTPDGLPGTFTEQIETWIEALPGDVPILRGWEKTSGRFNSVGPSGARRFHPSVGPASKVRRPAESAETAAQLLRGRAQIVSVTGRPGSGRTQLLSEITRQLDGCLRSADGHAAVHRPRSEAR